MDGNIWRSEKVKDGRLGRGGLKIEEIVQIGILPSNLLVWWLLALSNKHKEWKTKNYHSTIYSRCPFPYNVLYTILFFLLLFFRSFHFLLSFVSISHRFQSEENHSRKPIFFSSSFSHLISLFTIFIISRFQPIFIII